MSRYHSKNNPKAFDFIAMMGPTGAGKTKLSLAWAQTWDAEIVSVDSLLVYKDFNIGTAKPTMRERGLVRHHMIDVADPADAFTAGDFCKAAEEKINDCLSRGKRLLLVGGSGLYFKALLDGMFDIPKKDSEIGQRLAKRLKEEGSLKLHQELCGVDEASAKKIHPHDSYRIVRALEVYAQTGKPFSEYKREHKRRKKFRVLKMGLHLPQAQHHRQIQQRTESMLHQGLIEEVSALRQKYPLTCKPFQSVGYKETVQYLHGELSRGGLKEAIAKQTRALAKRQLTWFRSDPEIRWMNPDA